MEAVEEERLGNSDMSCDQSRTAEWLRVTVWVIFCVLRYNVHVDVGLPVLCVCVLDYISSSL